MTFRAKMLAVVVGLLGAVVGMFWIIIVGTALNLHTSLIPSWSIAMYITCPVVRVILLKWWLVPVLNGVLYAAVFTAVRWMLYNIQLSSPQN